MNRKRESIDGFDLIRDEHPEIQAEVCFLRWSGSPSSRPFVLATPFQLLERVESDSMGLVLHGSGAGSAKTLWLPRRPERYGFDGHGRPGADRGLAKGWTVEAEEGEVRVVGTGHHPDDPGAAPFGDGDSIALPFVSIVDPEGTHLRDLTGWSDVERRTYRVSEWFDVSSVASIWNDLIDGDVYDPRPSATTGGRFRSQQLARAWWHYLNALGRSTGKGLYGLLRDEVAGSVLLDLDEEGGWYHGFWWEKMETHARFQLDGIDLLLSQHRTTGRNEWLDAARRGMDYVLEHLTDPLDDGLLWFLHDSMEDRQDHRLRSRWLGRSPGNSLCLNTHLQALKVLYRLSQEEEDEHGHRTAYRHGRDALRRVLEHQPAGRVYGPLMRGILEEKVPIPKRRVLRRARRRLMKPLRRRLYWRLQERYPRLVHPNGFIDRDLSLSCASDRYHVTNLKDLLLLYELTGEKWLEVYIVGAMEFIRGYLSRRGLENALGGSPYFIEVVDIMVLYSRLIQPLPAAEIESVRNGVLRTTGAYSLEAELACLGPLGGS